MNAYSEGFSSSSNALICRRRLLISPWGSTMKFYISGSTDNPGRPYWKCIHWMLENSCKLFVWDDQLSGKHFTFRDGPSIKTSCGVSSQIQSCKSCHYAEKLIEAGTKSRAAKVIIITKSL